MLDLGKDGRPGRVVTIFVFLISAMITSPFWSRWSVFYMRIQPQSVVWFLMVWVRGPRHRGLKQVESSGFSFDFWSAGSPTAHGARRGASLIFAGDLVIGMGYARGTSSVMPGCRIPILPETRQQVGAVFCRKRSIETQTAVNRRPTRFLEGRSTIVLPPSAIVSGITWPA